MAALAPAPLQPGTPVDHYVSHFTTAATLVDHILGSRTLRLGRFSDTNDPWESLVWHFALGGRGGQSADVQKRLLLTARDRSGYWKRTTKVVCLARDIPLPLHDSEFFEGRGWASASMWDRYADKHRGACLIFDRQQLDEAIRQAAGSRGPIFSGGVSYRSSTFDQHDLFTLHLEAYDDENLDRVLAAHLDEHVTDLLLSKHLDWEHEQEYRWMLRDQDEAPVFVPFGGALALVLLGPGFPAARQQEASSVCDALGVECWTLAWRNGVPYPQHLPPPPASRVPDRPWIVNVVTVDP